MIKRSLFFSVVVLTLGACSVADDFSNLKTTIDTSLPFAFLALTDSELFEKSSLGDKVYVGEDDVLTFKNTSNLQVFDSDKIREVLDITFQNASFDFNDVVGTHPLPPGGTLPQDVLRSEVAVGLGEGVAIDKLTFDQGTVSFVNNPLLSGLTCTIPQITKQGVPLVLVSGQTVSMNDGWLVTLNEEKKLDLVYNGTYVPLAGGDAALDVIFTDLLIGSAEGFFGNKKINTVTQLVEMDASTVEFFGMMETLYLENPSVSIAVDNQFDVPVGIIVSSLIVNDGEKDVVVKMKKEFEKSAFLLPQGNSTIRLDNASTVDGKELSELINNRSRKISVSFDVIINPTSTQLFASQEEVPVVVANKFSSQMTADGSVDVLFPINGYFKNFVYNNTFRIDEYFNEINAETALFLITGSNGMPIDLEVTLYGVDAGGRETLFTKMPIVVDASETNVKPSDLTFKRHTMDQNNYQTVPLNVDVFNHLNDYDLIRYKINATTLNEENKQVVKFFSGVDFKINMILGTKADINL